MANLLDELHLRPDLEAYDESAKKRSPDLTDYLRYLAIGGVGDTARGLGELLQKGGVDYGKRMRQAGDEFEFDQTQEMSPGGRRAFTQPVFTENKDKLFGLEPNPEGAWGPAVAQAVRSAPQMAMMAAPAAPVAGALRAIPAVARAVEAGGFTGKAADVLTTGLPFGAAEGAQAGLTNAAQTRSKIEGMKHEELLASPEYRDLFDRTDASLSEDERHKLAKDELAAKAAQEVFIKTVPWTGTIGAVTGGGAPGVAMRAGGRGAIDFLKSTGKAALTEAGQEFPQSGGEQYFQNVAEKRAIPTQDPWEDVLGQAAGGAAVGAVTGAPIGAGHAIMGRPGGTASPVDRLVQIARSMRAPSAMPAQPGATAAPAPLQPGAPAAPAPPRVDTAAAAKTVQAAQAAAMAPTADDPVQALQTLPEAERAPFAKDWPKMEPGGPTQFQVPGSAQPIAGRFALAEADSLVASHSASLNENPAYPKALQPRDRTAAGYELQVAQMSQNLQPAMLGASPSATDGAPIVGPDGVIESGNGRWIALQRAYSEDKGARGQAYREWLQVNAPSFGLKPEQIQAMKKPILVRERMTPINRAEFARAANAPTTAQMGPLDQAKADAQRMGDLSGLAVGEDGNLFVPQNRDVVRGFFSRLPITEQTGLVDKEGRISQTGQRRFLNAVIVRAYGEHSPAVMRLVESVNPDLRGLLGGLTKIAPMVAKARDAIAAKNLADRDLTGLIVGAVDELMRLKSEGKSVADELAQSQMFANLPPGGAEVLQFLDANTRNPAKISQFVLNYLGELARYGQPGQNDMFGAPAVPGAPDLIRRAQEMTREQAPAAVQPGVPAGAAAAPGPAAVPSAALPEGAVGDLGAAPGAPETGKPAGSVPSPAEVEAKAAALKAEITGAELPKLPKENPSKEAEKPAETAQKGPESTLSQNKVPEVLGDRTLADAKIFGDGADAEALLAKGFKALDRDAQGVVLSKVIAALDEEKILRSVVQTVPVDVMNVLIGGERSADDLLHDPSVLAHRLTVAGDVPVPEPVVAFVDSLVGAVKGGATGAATEKPGLGSKPGAVELPGKPGAAVQAVPGERRQEVTIAGKTDEVNVTPSEGQREEGNYKKAHTVVGGLDISIENPEGSRRRPEWPILKAHYGYVKGVPARAPDKEHVDVFVKAGTPENFNGSVFVVDQNKEDGSFDEPKVMIGWPDEAAARAAYLENYQKGWESRVRGITTYSMEQFKAKLEDAAAFLKPQGDADAGRQGRGQEHPGVPQGQNIPEDQGGARPGGGEPASSSSGAVGGEKGGGARPAEAAPVGAYRQLANWVAEKLAKGEKFSNEELTTQAAEAFGGTAAAGRFSPRDAYDAMELGVNLRIAGNPESFNPNKGNLVAANVALNDLEKLMSFLPTQTKRTNEQIEYQQFSTPPTLSFLANWVGKVRSGESVLEPSAGTGDLAVFAKIAGANVTANEIAPRRADILKELGFEVTREDAEQINNVLPATVKPTLILMNPPFSSAGGRIEGQRNIENGIRHLGQAWERLEPGGRMVALMGENFGGPAASRRWLAAVRQVGEVRALITVSGKEYANYGTTYGTSLMVLDKTGKRQAGTTTEGAFQTVAEALKTLEGVRNERSEPQPAASVPEGERVPVEQAGSEARPEVRGETESAGAARNEPSPAPARPAAPAETQTKGPAPGEEGPGQAALPLEPGEPGQGERVSGAARPGGGEPETPGLRGPASVEPRGPGAATGEQPGVTLEKQEKKEQAKLTGEIFEAYTPAKVKIPGAKPHISELVESAAMASVLPPDATYTPNLPDSVVKGGKLSDSQLEAVVYAGQAHQSFLPNGDRRGFFIGDGCVAAGTRIYDPISGRHSVIESLVGRPHWVLSLTADGLVPHRAVMTFRKGVADLYRVRLADREIVVTDEHRFLTPGGWDTIKGGLSIGHYIATADPRPHGASCAPRASKTAGGSTGRCSSGSDRGDAPPLQAQGIAQGVSPSQGDALARSRSPLLAGGSARTRAHSRRDQCCGLLARSSFESPGFLDHEESAGQAPAWFARLLRATAEGASQSVRVSGLSTRRVGEVPPHQPELEVCSSHCAIEEPDHAREGTRSWSAASRRTALPVLSSGRPAGTPQGSPLHAHRGQIGAACAWSEILGVEFIRRDEFFDMYVPGPENYIAEGIINHNTGVGKGRELSGILLDNLRQGRKKAVWVSEKQGLIRDAQRDYGDTGGQPTELFPQAKVKASDPIERQSGILFTTYSTLRSSEKREATDTDKRIAKTRVKQLTDWLGPDFDGVIIFDESHNMQSAMKQKGKRGMKDASLQALAGLELQRVAPKARVVYSSATGATNVANLGYAQRLGLWGEQTAFADAPTFVSAIDSAGVSAMELVARDLKQMGMYIARSLSFKGVTYERVTHELSAVQRAMYDRMAEAWQITLQRIDEALALTGADESGPAKSAALSKYWGAQQRFFNQVITSMQMPTVLERIDEDLKRGDAVVLQLVNTMEAELDRKLALVEEDADLQDLDLTPRDALIQMVQKAFPVQEFHTVTKDGNEVSVPVLDSEGNPVLSKQAIAMREALIKDLEDIKVPEAPLDMVLKKFGTEMVAEVTGRSTRVVPVKDESGETKMVVEKRTASAAKADADAFMDDKKRILVFSGAGGTGYSFHSDRTKENQRKRQHYGVQLGWRADQAVQGFGRTHRSNEANQPNYKLAETNLKAQKRFISSIARALDRLGALTKGQRQASGQQLFDEKDNLEGVYAGRAIRQLIYDSFHGRESRVPFAEMIEGQMGLNLRNPETGVLADARLPDVPQFLNRLLSLKIKAQDAVFDAFFERMESMIEIAKQRNELDVGVQSLGALEVVKQDEKVVYTDERTKAETKILRLNATYPREFSKWAQVKERLDHIEAQKNQEHGIEGYYISTGDKTSGRPFVIYRWGTETNDRGGVDMKYQAITPMGVRYGVDRVPETAKKSTRAEVQKLWDGYIAKQSPTFDRIEHLLTGTILPVWDRMHGQFVKVVQTQTKDGERLLGRWIAPSHVEATLKAFGMSEVAKMTTEQLRSAVMDDNMMVVLANGWSLIRTRKAGELRLELITGGHGNASRAELDRYGAFTEVDGWKERTYLPVDDVQPLERLLKVRPAADIVERPKSYRAEQEGPEYQLEKKRKPPAKIEPGEIRDLFVIDPVTGNKSGPGVIETLVVTPVQKGTLHIGFDKIDTPEKAAHAFANLRKHPREYFNLLMLDGNDKPIAAAELFAGTLTQTSVYPREVTTLAYQTPGARKIWFAHNHPSGIPEPSHADEILTRSLASMFGKDIGIELMGHIIIAGTKANSFWSESSGYVARAFDIPPASRKFSIPLMERMVRKSTSGPKDALNSPGAVRDFIRKLAPGQDGLLWLDAQHRVQGWQPMTLTQMGNMKTGDIRTGAAELFRRIGRNNPAAAIAVVHDPEGTRAIDRVALALRSLKSTLALMDVQILDGFVLGGQTTVSLSERGVMQDTPKYSVAPRGGRGMTARQVQESLDRIAEGWNNAPTMIAVESVDQLPDRARTKAAAEGATARIQAVFDPVTGVMHVVAPAVGSVKELQFVVLHEVMGHYGLRGAFGNDLDAALQYLWTNNPKVRAKTAEAAQRWGYTMEDRKLDAIEEAVAELAAEGFKFNGIRQFFAAVQSWLRLHGMGELADWLEGLTDAELTSVLTMSRTYVVDGDMHLSGTGDVALSAAGPTWYSALRRHIDAMNVNQAGKEHWQRELEAAIKSGKVKKDEVEWSGIAQWLKAREGKIAKDEVLAFLGNNGINPSDVLPFVNLEGRTGANGLKELLVDTALQPDRAGESGKDVISSKDQAVMTLEEVKGAVPAAIHDDHIQRAIISRLPVDVVDNLAEVEATPEDFLRDPDVVMSRLTVDHRGGVANGFLVAMRSVSADFGTKFGIPEATRSEEMFLSALSADDLGSGEVVGPPPTEFGKHKFAPALAVKAGAASTGAEDSTLDVAGGIEGKELPAAKLADFLARHPEIIGKAMIRYAAENAFDSVIVDGKKTSITPSMRESVMRGLPLFAVAQGERQVDTPRFAVADQALSDQERANAILAQQTNQIRPLESLFKGATELTRLPKLTGFLYDKLVESVQKALPESAKAGLIDKYGVPEYVQDRFAETIGRERQQLRETGNLLDRMPVTREEARVAYQWLNQNAAEGDKMLEGVSPESQETLRGWKEWAHQMQGEAIRLGQLDADTAARNEYAYTHRSYLKYEQGKDKKSGAGSIRILGDQYRTRGLTDEIDTEDLAKWNPQWWERMRGKEDIGLKGKMFLKLEKRVGSKQGMAVLPGVEETAEPGRVTRRVYWPADQPVPARFADYDLEGTWEARWPEKRNVIMWRDFTPEERKAMGEIDDARYAIAKTSQLMIHDIEVGKLLEWLANHEARPEAPRDAEVVLANESLRQAYRPGTWVKVPESNAPGTKVAKYGKLAGLYVPGPIWNEIRQVVNQRYKPLGETYDQLLRLWKISKTALSPAVHMNNIMANVVMAEWQDLTAAHLAKAFRVMFVKDPAHKIILDKFEDAGGSVGMWTLSEIQKSQMEPLLAQLERDAASDNPDALVNAAAVIQALQAGRYRQAAGMVDQLGPVRGSKAVLDKMVEVYQGEDQIFRLAAFLKAKEDGQSDTAAGKFARESFLDYHITAPWINIMRSTAFPFVAFTYRALPLLAETLAKKPWKMLKFAAIAGVLDTLGYALSGGDEDKERKLLPEEKSGVIWGYSGRFPFTQMEVNLGVSPKLVRMPWNDQFGSPVFLDIRRFVPLGDIVDVGQVHSAIPLLPTMMPGGPLALVAELVANRSFFTGKEIVKESDSDIERTRKLGAYVYQWAMPNIPLVPGSYSYMGIKGAAAGETDVFGRERSVAQAAGSALGVRLASYPEDLGRQQVLRQLGAEKREIGENISALRRQFQRGGLDREEFEAKIKEQLDKRIQFETTARRRLSGG